MPQGQPELCLTAQLGDGAVGDTSRVAGAEGGKESPTRQFTLSAPSLSALVPSMKACYMVAREQVAWGLSATSGNCPSTVVPLGFLMHET